MPTFNSQVAQSSDDGSESAGGVGDITATSHGYTVQNAHFGCRFQNVTIPAGSTVNSAVLELYLPSAANDNPNFDIYGELAANPSTFPGTSNHLSSRVKTTATVLWSGTDVGSGVFISLPDITTIVQEIVNQGGWASGNAMVFLLKSKTGVACTIRPYDNTPSQSAKITITYTEPSLAITTVEIGVHIFDPIISAPEAPVETHGGVGWNIVQMMRSSTVLRPGVPSGETYTSMMNHGRDNGMKYICMMFASGDVTQPGFEVRPGEFFWPGDSATTRNGNGDLTGPLYSLGDACPAGSNVITLLDQCSARGMRAEIRLGRIQDLLETWDEHPYNANRRNATGNLDSLGTPGVLTSISQFFTNATAIGWFKNRWSAFIQGLTTGGVLHPALGILDVGNELLLWSNQTGYDRTAFFDWCEEVVDHIWNALPGSTSQKPIVTISSSPLGLGDPNDVLKELVANNIIPSDHLMWSRHDYRGWHTKANIWQNLMSIHLDDPNRPIGITENWPNGTGPIAVPTSFVDSGFLDGNPSTLTGVYDTPPDPEGPPYAHTRMEIMLVHTIPQFYLYSRWPNQIDGYYAGSFGTQPFYTTYKRIAEVQFSSTDFANTAVQFYKRKKFMYGQVQSSGTLDFKSASAALDSNGDNYVFFVLTGSGTQTIDFNLPSGTWKATTYAWNQDAPTSVLDASNINPNSWSLNFGSYSRNFVGGYLHRVGLNMTTVNSWVQANNGDAAQVSAGTMDISAAAHGITTANSWYGWRFPGITIPSSATITGCWIDLYFHSSSALTPNGTFYFQDSTSGAVFTTGANDISNRSLYATSQAVNTTVSLGWNSFDLTSIMSAFYASYSSLSNAPIVVLYKSNSGNNTNIRTHNYLTIEYSARLVIQYTTTVTAPTGQPMNSRGTLVPGLRTWTGRRF